jgi:murein DD-endopeptidase MepM/ murein hydrolase activator NlpD
VTRPDGDDGGDGVIQGERRKLRDWEWREDEYARRRERTRVLARRRGRLRLAALILAIVIIAVSGVLAARAVSVPSPYARAALAMSAGKMYAPVAVTASRSDNEETATADGVEGTATWSDGQTTVSSTVVDGALNSTATATLSGIVLLDGRITVDSMALVADAAATRSTQSGGVDLSTITGLKVDGQAVDLAGLPRTISGVGTLIALETRQADESTGLEVEVTGLRVHLTSPWKGLPEGSDIVVGSAAACADEATAARLLPRPASGDASGASPGSPGGSSGASSSGGSSGGGNDGTGGNGGSDAGSSGSSGGGSPSGGGASPESFHPGKMPAPTKTSGKLLSFVGAVFPVNGQVWYSDDFGAPRAVGGGHTGNDIFARRGTPIVAVQGGTVQELRYRSLGGNSFHLVNDQGDYFYYAHLLRYDVGIGNGSVVAAGQVLGYVGNTGNAITTPPHLHFEIHPGGAAPVDPYPYLEKWRGESASTASGSTGSDDASAQSTSSTAPPAVSVEAEWGRHERAVTLAGLAPHQLEESRGGIALIPAAVSFGILAGLMTSAVRRRRTSFSLVTMDLDDLHRAARAG